jgi:hypothetical protein
MASQERVKQYLAYWFQLGKRVILRNGEAFVPKSVIEGDRYSKEFELCWQQILASKEVCHIEGTTQTFKELLASNWNVLPCARCGMPVPSIDLGIQPNTCPCHDLDNWPNYELPSPRAPIDNQFQLEKIRERLNKAEKKS